MTSPLPTGAHSQPLDSCARLHLDRRGRIGSYVGCGVVGGLAGSAVAVAVTVAAGLSITVAATAVAACLLSLFIGIKLRQLLVGDQTLVLYEQLFTALAGTAASASLMSLPVWSCVDVAVVGVGTFLIFGRIGCLRVGCCHGRPARRGIAYGDLHAAAGFPSYYVGVRLFPLQLVGSLVAVIATGLATTVLLGPHRPGEATATWLATYGPLRLLVELARGDAVRPQLLGLSEAQWTAVAAGWTVAAAGASYQLDHAAAYWVAAVVTTVAAMVVLAATRLAPNNPWSLRAPHRLAELASALVRLANQATVPTDRAEVAVVTTASGLRLSRGATGSAGAGVQFTVSSSRGPLSRAALTTIARQLALLERRRNEFAIRPGTTDNVAHILFGPGAS